MTDFMMGPGMMGGSVLIDRSVAPMQAAITAYEEGERMIGHIDIRPDAGGAVEPRSDQANK